MSVRACISSLGQTSDRIAQARLRGAAPLQSSARQTSGGEIRGQRRERHDASPRDPSRFVSKEARSYIGAMPPAATTVPPMRSYKYYDMVMAGFVTVLLCSNIIGPGKVCSIAGFTFGAGNLFF